MSIQIENTQDINALQVNADQINADLLALKGGLVDAKKELTKKARALKQAKKPETIAKLETDRDVIAWDIQETERSIYKAESQLTDTHEAIAKAQTLATAIKQQGSQLPTLGQAPDAEVVNELDSINVTDAEAIDLANASHNQVNECFQTHLEALRRNERGGMASFISMMYRKSIDQDGHLTARDQDVTTIVKLLRERTPYNVKIQKKEKPNPVTGVMERLAYVKIVYKPEVDTRQKETIEALWYSIPVKFWHKPESKTAGQKKEVKPFKDAETMQKAAVSFCSKVAGSKAAKADALRAMAVELGLYDHIRDGLEAISSEIHTGE